MTEVKEFFHLKITVLQNEMIREFKRLIISFTKHNTKRAVTEKNRNFNVKFSNWNSSKKRHKRN